MAYMRNFGHNGPESFFGVGINAKNSEYHAAMGLCNLKYIDEIKEKRKSQSEYYDNVLEKLDIETPQIISECTFNYAYYPVIFKSEKALLKAKEALERNRINPRRYFYPSLSSLNYVTSAPTPVSDNIAERILCLPLYHTLSKEEQDYIARILLRTQNY